MTKRLECSEDEPCGECSVCLVREIREDRIDKLYEADYDD